MELFLAIDFDWATKCAVEKIAVAVRTLTGEGCHYENREKYHLTLCYLHHVDCSQTLIDRMKQFEFSSFSLQPQGLGTFENSDGGVIWVGIVEDGGTLCALKSALDTYLESLGYQTEPLEYTPHITLAYTGAEPLPNQGALTKIPTDLPCVTVGEIALFRAPLSVKSGSYEKLASFSLKGERSR